MLTLAAGSPWALGSDEVLDVQQSSPAGGMFSSLRP